MSSASTVFAAPQSSSAPAAARSLLGTLEPSWWQRPASLDILFGRLMLAWQVSSQCQGGATDPALSVFVRAVCSWKGDCGTSHTERRENECFKMFQARCRHARPRRNFGSGTNSGKFGNYPLKRNTSFLESRITIAQEIVSLQDPDFRK